MKRSAAATAALLVLNTALYAEEKGREVSRCRLSRAALRGIAGWHRLSVNFLEDLAEELEGLGWRLLEVGDTEFAIIIISKIDTWPKLGNKRLFEAGWLRASEEAIFDAYEARFPESTVDSAALD